MEAKKILWSRILELFVVMLLLINIPGANQLAMNWKALLKNSMQALGNQTLKEELKSNIIMVNSKNTGSIKTKETWRRAANLKNKNVLILKEEFNKEGHITKETTYGKNLLPLTKTTWKYNEFGDFTSQTIDYVEKGEKYEFTFEYEYSQGRKIKIRKYDSEKELVQEHLFKYGSNIEEKILRAGEITKIKVYDSKHQKLISEESLANNFIEHYQYDASGNLIEIRKKQLNKPARVIGYMNEYNEENRLIRQQRNDEVLEMEYNPENQIIERRSLKQGKIVRVLFYRYTYYKR